MQFCPMCDRYCVSVSIHGGFTDFSHTAHLPHLQVHFIIYLYKQVSLFTYIAQKIYITIIICKLTHGSQLELRLETVPCASTACCVTVVAVLLISVRHEASNLYLCMCFALFFTFKQIM